MNKNTLADIMQSGFESYLSKTGSLPIHYYKAVHDIMQCRTEEKGGHKERCECCGHEKIMYNSCRNRHCPHCQGVARQRWIDARNEDLLPVPYFHAVFTIPQELNPWALRNKEIFYGILLRSVKETLLELSADRKRLGAHIGFIMMLHTWGQSLMDHPHVHCIVPAGGLSEDRSYWIPCKKSFLFPFKVMSKLFRGKLLSYFRGALDNKTIAPVGDLDMFTDKKTLNRLIDMLYKKEWVVYAKQPLGRSGGCSRIPWKLHSPDCNQQQQDCFV